MVIIFADENYSSVLAYGDESWTEVRGGWCEIVNQFRRLHANRPNL